MKKREALFLVVIFLFPLVSGVITGEVITGEVITGDVTQGVGMNITVISVLPSITLLSPENKTYISNSSLYLNYIISNKQAIWYNLDGNPDIIIYSLIFLNTTEGSHMLHLFANNTYGDFSEENVTFFVNLTLLTIIYSEFEGQGDTTVFDMIAYEDLEDLAGIILEVETKGKIEFLENINLTDDANVTDYIVDLDGNIDISSNRIEIDSDALPNFNKSATLYIYGLSFDVPRILRNGVECSSSICAQNSYSGGILSFNVTNFAVYTVEEDVDGPQLSPGGGGGGGTPSVLTYDFSVDTNLIEVTLFRGEGERRTLKINNTGKDVLTFEDLKFEGVWRFLRSSQKSFSLVPGATKEIIIDITVGEDEEPGTYLGRIKIEGNGVVKFVNVLINVEEEGALFRVDSELTKERLKQNEKIKAKIIVFQNGAEKRDIVLEYYIRDFVGLELMLFGESVFVEDRVELNREFALPANLEPGDYVFYVKLIYDDKVASSSNAFTIEEGLLEEELDIILIVPALVILAAILAAIYYFVFWRKKNVEKSKVNYVKFQKFSGG